MMIIISIGGGLGNQMFEYAFYCMFKHLYPDVEVKLDIMHTLGDNHNGYELEKIFGVQAEKCTKEELNRVSDIYPVDGAHYKYHHFIERIRHKICGYKESCIVQRDFTVYDDSFFHLDMSKSYYLYGVFANYRFFSDIDDKIRAIYQFPQIKDATNMNWQDEIRNSESVGIHIRHGDYTAWGVDLVPEKFYRKAIDYLQDRMLGKKLKYFVFTDDPVYAKKTYSDIADLQVIEGNTGKNSYIDMQLMSLCKHNIIANSTFGFWGAYLNQNISKIIVVPNMPYTGCKNLFACDEWVRM